MLKDGLWGLRVEVFGARGIKHSNVIGILNAFEPYVRITVAGQIRAETLQLDSGDLEWNEVFYLLVPSIENPITVELMSSATAVVGKANIQIENSSHHQPRTGIQSQTPSPGSRGELNLGFQFFRSLTLTNQAEMMHLQRLPPTHPRLRAETRQDADKSRIAASSCTERIPFWPPKLYHSRGKKSCPQGIEHLLRSQYAQGRSSPHHKSPHLANYDPNTIKSHVRKQSSAPTWEESYEFLIADPNTDAILITFMAKSGNVMSSSLKKIRIWEASPPRSVNYWVRMSGLT